jgi:hypothetical protein
MLQRAVAQLKMDEINIRSLVFGSEGLLQFSFNSRRMQGNQFCTVFVPPTRHCGCFSPSSRTQNQQLTCYQYPMKNRFRPWPPYLTALKSNE